MISTVPLTDSENVAVTVNPVLVGSGALVERTAIGFALSVAVIVLSVAGPDASTRLLIVPLAAV